MNRMTAEVAAKVERLRGLIAERKLGGIVLGTLANYAWLSGGGSSLVSAVSDRGVAALLLDEAGIHLVATNIEAARQAEEQLPGLEPASLKVCNWFETALPAFLGELGTAAVEAGRPLGADVSGPGLVDLSAEIAALRRPFLPKEVERFRSLAADHSAVFEAALPHLRPGMTEWEIAGVLSGEAYARGAQVVGVLVGVDGRALTRRHPFMVGQCLEHYALMGMVIQRGGLHTALSRCVHFGPLPEELRRRHEAVSSVFAALLDESRPGVRLEQALTAAQAAYAAAGFPGEWRHHHQGGALGYQPREYVAMPGSTVEIVAPQGLAWNPTVQGTKCEETVLVTENGPEILTHTPSWPVLRRTAAGREVTLAGILEL
ncbi:MAG: M24 family metallopeptidase [Methanocella sp.]